MYHLHTSPDLWNEMQLTSQGRLVKARLPDQDVPNVSWYWFAVGNCTACKNYAPFGIGRRPECLDKGIKHQEFMDHYVNTNDCPKYAPGASKAAVEDSVGWANKYDVMRAIGLAPGKPKQAVEVIVDEPWNIDLAQRAHEEQSQFLHMAYVADAVARGEFINDPDTLYSGGYTDLADDLEATWARREANNPVPDADPDDTALSTDAHGIEHKGKGPGGGQFVKKGGPFAPPDTVRQVKFNAAREIGEELGYTTYHLTDEQAEAAIKYTGDSWGEFNKVVRGQAPAEDHPEAMELYEALASAPILDKPVTTYRGVSLASPAMKKIIEGMEAIAGTDSEVEISGFSSTSLQPHQAINFAEDDRADDDDYKGVVFEIAANKGLYLGERYSSNPKEFEFLLNHNSRFRVVAVHASVPTLGEWGEEKTMKVIQLEQVA